MLQNDLYTITAQTQEGDAFRVGLALNAGHPIFEGHFPGRPVVPGVCLIEMVREVSEIALAVRPLRLVTASQIKFIAFIDPRVDGELELRLTPAGVNSAGEAIHITATISAGAKICFKFNGIFAGE